MLEINDLSISYGSSAPVVSNISFQLRRGSTLGIVGESGSGKSSVAWTILGLLPTQAKATGSILYEGQDLLEVTSGNRRRLRGEEIAMVFQDPFSSLNPCLTIGQQLTEVIIERKLSQGSDINRQAIRMLDEVRLPRPAELLSSYPHELSGGMRQRVIIAMALACSPQLLILDEPTTALDVTVEAHVLKLLKELQSERELTMLFISHNLGIVEQMCSEIAVMERGLMVEKGNAQRILFSPTQPYTKRLIAALPRIGKEPSLPDKPASSSNDIVVRAANINLKFRAKRGLADRLFKVPDRSVTALRNVSLDLRRGEVVGIVGESGSGKSTLGRCLVGAYKTDGGKIEFGQGAGTENRATRREIQIVFQNPDSSLNPRHTVEGMLSRALKLRGVPAHGIGDEVRHLLELVKLSSSFGSRYPHQLSGGEKQRIGIARALAMNPRVLICDEITSALDVSVQAAILELIQDLKHKSGVSMIFISHDLAVISQISDRIVVMKGGEIVEEGTPGEVLFSPKEKYTQGLIAAIPPFIRAHPVA